MGSEGLDILDGGSINHPTRPTHECLILGVRALKDSIVASELGSDIKLRIIRTLNSVEMDLIEDKLPGSVQGDNLRR